MRACEAGPVLIRVAVARTVRAARICTLEGLYVVHHTGCTETGSEQEPSGSQQLPDELDVNLCTFQAGVVVDRRSAAHRARLG